MNDGDRQIEKAESHDPEIFRRNYRVIRVLLQCQYFLTPDYSKRDLQQNQITENIKAHQGELEDLLDITLDTKAATETLFHKILRAMGAEISKEGDRYGIANPDQLLLDL